MLHQLIVNVRKPFLKMVPIPTPELYEGKVACRRFLICVKSLVSLTP